MPEAAPVSLLPVISGSPAPVVMEGASMRKVSSGTVPMLTVVMGAPFGPPRVAEERHRKQ